MSITKRKLIIRRLQSAAVALFACATGWSSCPAAARTLEVGADHALKTPSAAAAVAVAGDTIEVEAGEYVDCAVWTADRLTILGKGFGVIVAAKSCQGKGLFVTVGSDITIRNITFTRARVPDRNGAGIRAEGHNLTVVHSRFIDNENGILAGEPARGTILISDSEFIGNGKCEGSCAHGIYVGHIARLRIESSRFFETKIGHHVKSRALRTELIGNEITDGAQGTSSYLVDIPNGGSLVMERNVLEKGPNSSNRETAVSIGAEGVMQPTDELIIKKNKFANDEAVETVFVRNLSGSHATLVGNSFRGRVVPLVEGMVVR